MILMSSIQSVYNSVPPDLRTENNPIVCCNHPSPPVHLVSCRTRYIDHWLFVYPTSNLCVFNLCVQQCTIFNLYPSQMFFFNFCPISNIIVQSKQILLEPNQILLANRNTRISNAKSNADIKCKCTI